MRLAMTMTAMAAMASVTLAGCSQVVETGVADHLEQAGVPAGMARCMAQAWTERLSAQQLVRLGQAAAQLAEGQQQGSPLVDVVNRAEALNDPQIVEVVTQSAVACVAQI
ncbi:MAG: hypothetical protein JWL74_282 [Alphaproteobacteria bacterium]|jgi:hypothetical protein|nr:hypothetical protein [Alphaproteobacteria bacterium]